MLKAAENTVAHAVATSLDALDLEDTDAGMARLARQYADAIDALDEEMRPKLIGVIGPSLQKALESLGASPAARATIGKKVKGAGEDRSALGKLRAARGA